MDSNEIKLDEVDTETEDKTKKTDTASEGDDGTKFKFSNGADNFSKLKKKQDDTPTNPGPEKEGPKDFIFDESFYGQLSCIPKLFYLAQLTGNKNIKEQTYFNIALNPKSLTENTAKVFYKQLEEQLKNKVPDEFLSVCIPELHNEVASYMAANKKQFKNLTFKVFDNVLKLFPDTQNAYQKVQDGSIDKEKALDILKDTVDKGADIMDLTQFERGVEKNMKAYDQKGNAMFSEVSLMLLFSCICPLLGVIVTICQDDLKKAGCKEDSIALGFSKTIGTITATVSDYVDKEMATVYQTKQQAAINTAKERKQILTQQAQEDLQSMGIINGVKEVLETCSHNNLPDYGTVQYTWSELQKVFTDRIAMDTGKNAVGINDQLFNSNLANSQAVQDVNQQCNRQSQVEGLALRKQREQIFASPKVASC